GGDAERAAPWGVRACSATAAGHNDPASAPRFIPESPRRLCLRSMIEINPERLTPSPGASLRQQLADEEAAQIGFLEIGERGERLDVADHDNLPVDADEPVLAQLPQGAVDVWHAEAQRIADQFLGQR